MQKLNTCFWRKNRKKERKKLNKIGLEGNTSVKNNDSGKDTQQQDIKLDVAKDGINKMKGNEKFNLSNGEQIEKKNKNKRPS